MRGKRQLKIDKFQSIIKSLLDKNNLTEVLKKRKFYQYENSNYNELSISNLMLTLAEEKKELITNIKEAKREIADEVEEFYFEEEDEENEQDDLSDEV